MSVLIISLLILGVFTLAVVLLAQGKMLTAKGINGWTILIPGYGEFVFFKTTADCGMLLVVMLVMIVLGIVASFLAPIFGIFFLILVLFFYFIFSLNLAEAYNRETAFAIGLFLLPPVFFWMLAYPSKETEPVDRKLLRLLSLAFAVGLLVVSVGLGGLFYKNRTDPTAITAAYEAYKLDESALIAATEQVEEEPATEESGENPETTEEEAAPEMTAEETVSDTKTEGITLAKYTPASAAIGDEPETAQEDDLTDAEPVPYVRYRVVQDSGREKFGWAFLRADVENAMKAELRVSDYDKMITRKRQVALYKAKLETVISAKRAEFGFRYYLLEAGVWAVVFLIAGILIAGSALALWIVYGGRISNIAQTVFWIPVLAVIACAVTFLCAGLTMTTVSDDIMKKLIP